MTTLVIGIGNRWRGDDGAGPEVAARVAKLALADVDVIVEDEPLALLDHLAGYAEVIVVDAARPGGHAGRVYVWPVGSEPLPRDPHVGGSHGLGVVDAVELARAIGRLPRRLTLVGIEARTFEPGSLSAQVVDRLGEAVQVVCDVVAASRQHPSKFPFSAGIDQGVR